MDRMSKKKKVPIFAIGGIVSPPGLNYNSTVSKMKEDAASGVDTEKDGLTKLLVEARDSMNEVPDME